MFEVHARLMPQHVMEWYAGVRDVVVGGALSCSSPQLVVPLEVRPIHFAQARNMNSEIASNLVTTGVGSETAPVEVDEPILKRLRPATSNVWNFFKKLERAECKGCKKVFKARGKRYGTSTIKRHLDSCTQIKHEDIGQTIAELQLKMGRCVGSMEHTSVWHQP
ncbi:hypothetical protein Ahy_A04g019328 [Arachis hypogaea]|uniref:BED-type domain-containing protein n=1 Tax=Arachis hypogaea TaxID=3818 RepID=A0A445DFR8_ARAHY|nr:hypothetical protein Ahy_A04g019328 [Arachis hypogaea]